MLAAVALASCGGETQRNEVGPGEVARELSRVEVRPGLWDVSTEIVSATQQGMPHELAERMKGRRRAFRHCITPEQAARPDANFLAARRSGQCRDEAFAMRAGRISGTMLCRDPAGAETRVRMSGDYGAERYDMRMEIETPGIGAGRVMTLVTRQAGRRIGDCSEEGETKK
jgi:hypothetical protein